jgi:predicted Rossmann-fold nucleotide-binding protein
VLTASQLGWHPKPFGLLDIAGFYSPLLEFLDHTRNEGFIRPQHRELVLVADDAEKLLQHMKNFRPPGEVKWVK